MKRVLVIGFSQTGQLQKILETLAHPIKKLEEVELVQVQIKPSKSYPFPWPILSFFDLFPEAIYLDAEPNQALEVDGEFDLIILGYQPWFLSPSLPTTAFLKSELAKTLLKDKPVITVVGCRNMWGQAHLQVGGLLKNLGANWIDNVVLSDQGKGMETFITTPRWLLTGKKDSFWKLSPAGIAEEDIQNSVRFGRAISAHLASSQPITQSLLYGLGAVKADASLLQAERIGKRSFMAWGWLLRKLGSQGAFIRKPVLLVYIVFLILMIVTVVPISMLVRKLLHKLNPDKVKNLEMEFELPSGSDTSRMKDFL